MTRIPAGLRAKLDANDLLKIVLVLVVIWLIVAIAEEFFDAVQELLGPFDGVIGLLIILVIVLFLLDRI